MKTEITKFIVDYVMSHNKEQFYREPLVGFADAKSPALKDEGNPAPSDILPSATIVVSYFIPFTKDLNQSNKKDDREVSFEWAKCYEDANELFVELNNEIVNFLIGKGYEACIPDDKYLEFDREKVTSHWSQRSMGYAAGLGTYGINNMLITKKGCCGRLSSVITNLDVAPDEIMQEEQCLYKAKGVCGVCVKKCVAGALQDDDFDRKACYEICYKNSLQFKDIGTSYGGEFGSEVCGKCISLSPCAYK